MIKETPTIHEAGCKCAACATGQRNRFFKGKMMKAPGFEMEQRYGIERRRMLTRAIAGWGVVRGLELGEEETTYGASAFSVSPGLALDPHGREIVLGAETVIGADNTFVIGSGCELRSVDRLEHGDYILAIHYAEHSFGDSALPDDCCGTRTEKNYVCETALFSLRKLEGEKCPCGECDCPEGCRCRRHRCLCGKRARNSCLCEWTARTEGPGRANKPCRWKEYEVWVDDCVDLACVHISRGAGDCRPPLGHIEDDCSPRRIVKNNDLLYNLIRGCDLTRIEYLSWGEWHRSETPVPWDEFVAKLSAGEEGDNLMTDLTVHFTGPVLAETVTADCFTLQLALGRGWLRTRVVEITRVLTPHHDGDPKGTTRKATLCVRPEWYKDLTHPDCKFRKRGTFVQIEVRGDFILDCHGQPVDANARGFALRPNGHVEPSGNGTPGGVLISVFRVAKAHDSGLAYSGDEYASEEEYRYEQPR